MRRLAQARVIIVGLGGVGSWCAESLVRTGLHHLTIVDADRVCITNINRQLQATVADVGREKAAVLQERLLAIHPLAKVEAVCATYGSDTQNDFDFDDYDVVVDAIDSLASKALLLHRASCSRAAVFSSFGAACKLDPGRVRVAEFHQVKGCPLGSKLRKLMRRGRLDLEKPVTVVYSDEKQANKEIAPVNVTSNDAPQRQVYINGSLAHMTGIFGLTLASCVVQLFCESSDNQAVSL